MSASLNDIIYWISHYGYWVLFPLVVVEGPISTVIAGALAAIGAFDFWAAYLVVTIADITGDTLYYAAGRLGGESFVRRYGHFFGLDIKTIENLKNHFDRHAGKTLFIGKVSHGIGGVFLVAAGLADLPFNIFLGYDLIATLFKSLLLLSIGYYFSRDLYRVNAFLQVLALVLLALLVTFFVWYRFGQKKSENSKND